MPFSGSNSKLVCSILRLYSYSLLFLLDAANDISKDLFIFLSINCILNIIKILFINIKILRWFRLGVWALQKNVLY